MQNKRDDNAIRNLKPSFIRENELDYDYSKENVFSGGNEFRYFDIRTIRRNGENVVETKFIRPDYHINTSSGSDTNRSGLQELQGNEW